METLKTFFQGVEALPSFPAVGVRIIQEMRKENASINELAAIISYDPALTAKMLKVANSSFYSCQHKVDSIERAVSVLGLKSIKDIALSFTIVKGFKKNTVDRFDHELFWKRSITAAVSAEMIASALKMNRNDIFVTSLLMDIGVLVMYLSKPAEYLSVIDEKLVSHVSTVESERAVFQFDHQELGSEILKEWELPENIYMPIAFHHRITDCPQEYLPAAEVLMLADMASSVYFRDKSTQKLKMLSEEFQKRLHMSEDDVNVFVSSIGEKTIEILKNFDIDSGGVKPFLQMVKEANEEIGKLNLSYEQLVLELKQEKKRIKNLSNELKNANTKLGKVSSIDSLTGIHNHRFFQECMEKEMERAERYKRSMSLILMDIDNFKSVNSTYDYKYGDTVLRAIAELLTQTIRKPDFAARYGGDEFAVVLPEQDIRGAVILAERLRQLAERLEIKTDNHAVKITLSVGVSMYTPGKDINSRTKLVDAAYRALHYSKVTGRNKLSVVPMASN